MVRNSVGSATSVATVRPIKLRRDLPPAQAQEQGEWVFGWVILLSKGFRYLAEGTGRALGAHPGGQTSSGRAKTQMAPPTGTSLIHSPEESASPRTELVHCASTP